MVGLLTLLSCFSAEWRIGKNKKKQEENGGRFHFGIDPRGDLCCGWDSRWIFEEGKKNNFAQPRGYTAKSLREWNKTRAGAGGESNFSFALVRPSWFQPRENRRRIAKELVKKKKKRKKRQRRLMTLAAAIGWSGDAKTPHTRRTCDPSQTLWFF